MLHFTENSDDPRGASNVYIKIADNAEVLPCYTQGNLFVIIFY